MTYYHCSRIMLEKTELAGVVMKVCNKVTITGVRPGSIAGRYGIRPGDRLLAVNGVVLRDFLDYRYAITASRLRLSLERPEGYYKVVVEKDEDEDLGLVFDTDCFDGIKRCRNRCVFCFVDQLPRGLRPSLYVKDDDYRLSFLHGNFITLTNLVDAEVKRILTYHLSPLYISVHATDPEVRGFLLGQSHPAPVLEQIAALAEGGIAMHIQVVLCPGINDGDVLRQTIKDLACFWPMVASIGIVPVGLTRHRTGLPVLRSFISAEASHLVREIRNLQEAYRKRLGVSLVYLADEFYLKGREPLPKTGDYDGFPQLENGIGLCRLYYDQFRHLTRRLPERLPRPRRYWVATARSGARALQPVLHRLNLIGNLRVNTVRITNTFFGPRINVAGLLTGRDLIWGLRGLQGERVLLPGLLFRKGTRAFLDGLTLDQVAVATGCHLLVVNNDAESLVRAVLQ